MKRHFACESYIGTPLSVDGEQVGVVSFISPNIRDGFFSPQDVDIIQLIATWIGNRMTSQRQREALREAGDLARAANAAKSVFLAQMSHELRTPMNGVVGMAQVLSESQLNADQHDLLDTMRGSAESLLAIIDDILDLSKIEAGHLQLNAVPFRLSSVIDETLTVVQTRADGKGLALRHTIDPACPQCVVADSLRIKQVLGQFPRECG